MCGAGTTALFRVVAQFEHSHKRFGRYLYRTETAHFLFAFFLLFKQLLFARDVAAVALGENILAHCLYRLARDYARAYRSLYRYLEKLTRDVVLQPLGYLAGAGICLFLVNDEGKCVYLVAV